MIRVMVCSICKETKRENLILFGNNICTECEGNLVKLKVEDVTYRLYMDEIKQILTTTAKE